MTTRRIVRYVLICAATIGFIFLFSLTDQEYSIHNSINDGRTSTLLLEPPSFVRVVQAGINSATDDIGTKLDQEAGISAYYKSTDPITLSLVRGQYRTIETEATDYIIGSVAVEDYVEHFDAHVYVHKDGWILAYYLKDTPVSKIVDTKTYNISTSKLISAIAKIASAAGVPFSDASYYDFRYPNATKMMFVYEDSANGNDFTILLPSNYSYYERSYIVSGYPSYGFKIDGNSPTPMYQEAYLQYGYVLTSMLQTDITHTVVASHNAVLIIVYRES